MIKSRSAAIRLLALSFALGGLVGGAATMLAERNSHPDGPRDSGAQAYASMLKVELGLSVDEQKVVGAILQRHEPAMDSIWRIVRPQFTAERQVIRREIRAVLTSEQVVKYDRLIARRDSIHRARDNAHGK